MKWYERAAEVLGEIHHGPVFGLVGDANMKLVTSLIKDQGMAYYSSRHENAAVSMAIGYAKATGKIGVCSVTQGPGLTNCLTALVAGARGRAQILMIGGCAPTSVPDHPQRLNQSAMFEAVGVGTIDLTTDRSPEDLFSEAFERVRRERRPIVINLPSDLQDKEVERIELKAAAVTDAALPLPSAADLSRAVTALKNAKRPMIIAGRGAIWSGARAEISALAERTGALLGCTLPAYGLFAGHPNDIGVIGGYATNEASEVFASVDCVIGFGTSLGYRTTKYGKRFASDATIVHCDTDPAALDALTPATIGLIGDAKDVARAITERLPPNSRSFARDIVPQMRSAATRAPKAEPGNQLHPVALMHALERYIPKDRTVVVDGGHCSGFPPIYMTVPDDSGFYFSLEFGSIALGIGAAIGASVARPDRLGVLVVGDGSLLMSLPDVESAARQNIPLLIVVMNDNAYGAERHLLDLHGVPHNYVSLFENPKFDEVARALGGQGRRVETIDELAELPSWLDGLKGPLVLDCQVNPEVRGEWLRAALDR